MKIYVAHATSMDYEEELYKPLASQLGEHEFYFPHAVGNEVLHSQDIIGGCDLMIAEVSHKSTGVGIELGTAAV